VKYLNALITSGKEAQKYRNFFHMRDMKLWRKCVMKIIVVGLHQTVSVKTIKRRKSDTGGI
jgi:hypothetical protein